MQTSVQTALRDAIKGLVYSSESDETFRTVSWKNAGETLSDEEVLRLGKQDPHARVERLKIEDFFQDLTSNEEDPGSAARFAELFKVITSNLSDPEVIRVGQIEVAIFIVGRTKSGDWVGVRTFATVT